MRTRIGAARVGVLVVAALGTIPAPARAQQPSATPPATTAPARPAQNTAAAPRTAAAPEAEQAAPMAVPNELVRVQPGGLTADQVGVRAGTTSWNARASMESVRAAAARVDEAWASFLPRLSGVAKYTRLSDFTPPNLSSGGSIVGTLAPSGTVIAAPNASGQTAFTGPYGLQALNFSFPLVLDNWLLQATLTVPISDYFLRIDQNYTVATRSEEAARWDVVTARATSASNGKIAYYMWLRSRAAVVADVQALNDQKTHLKDAQNQFAVGNASKADVLRAETAVAAAELVVERAKNQADLAEKQVRVAIHAADEDVLVPGEDLESTLPPAPSNVKPLTAEALSSRPEIKSADANASSARAQAEAARAGRYPVLSAFADGIYANPNPRFIPQSNAWFGTWDVGAQLTWTPNDILASNGSINESVARAANIEANKNVVRDGIEVEVTQDWQAVGEADFSIGTSERELASAQEAYRVARELFNNGRGTSTTLADAEKDLQSARLDLLNAKAEARIARIRLEHALGRDASP